MSLPADVTLKPGVCLSSSGVSPAPADPGFGRSDARGDAASSRARPAYKPQFSTSSSWILERLRKGETASGTDASGAPSPLVSAAKGEPSNLATKLAQPTDSTLDMPSLRPQQPLAGISDDSKRLLRFSPPSLKRKRSCDDLEPDFTRSTIPFPSTKLPQSATSSPHLKEASEPGGARQCSSCGQSSLSSGDNAFVTCISCLSLSHLQCASATTDAADNVNYRCLECKTGSVEEQQTGAEDPGPYQRRLLVKRIRNKRLSKLPAGVVPAKPELVGFLARQASDFEVKHRLTLCSC